NAIKFTEQGSVRVSVSRVQATEESATLLFVIRDTGIGIAEDELDHI
ncbi:MAG TPA: hybrid sensor histidine kinase/response regulator, partial [Myxococcales bacterium]|nr:hybrid sensor histidine kinase/response regulator [Myxococcales bacterium]